MELSKDLTEKEFIHSDTAKRKGIDNSMLNSHRDNAKQLANKIFQPSRDHFNKPLFLSSGYRSKALNDAIGGAYGSQHSKGMAMDLDQDAYEAKYDVSNYDVFWHIHDNLDFDQLIWEYGDSKNPDWVHVSYDKSKAKQRKSVITAHRNSNGETYYTDFVYSK